MPKENKAKSKENLQQNLEQIKALVEECLSGLSEVTHKKEKSIKTSQRLKQGRISELDFTMSARAFIKRYAKGMSGPKKFTLLLAHLAKGDADKSIKFDVIKKHWKKGLFGGEINSFYSTQAKDKDWIDSKKKEEYNLRPSWKEIFKK